MITLPPSRAVVLTAVLVVCVIIAAATFLTMPSQEYYSDAYGTIYRQDASSSVSTSSAPTMGDKEEADMRQDIARSKQYEERNVAFAEGFVFNGIPADFVETCNEDLGFCFSHPKEWGTLSLVYAKPCIQEYLFDILGDFSKPGALFSLESSVLFTQRKKECEPWGDDFMRDDPFRDIKSADRTIDLPGGQIGVWYEDKHTSFMVYSNNIVATAPTKDPVYSRVAITGPSMKRPETTQQNIDTFLTVLHSYRLIEE